MLQKFAMVKYGVFVAKICKHALRASAVRDIWWSPLARQLLPPCSEHGTSCPVLMMRVHTMCTTVIASLSKRHHLGSFDAGADSGIRPGALCADLDWQLLHCGHFALPASTLQLPTILCLVRCVQQFTVRVHKNASNCKIYTSD